MTGRGTQPTRSGRARPGGPHALYGVRWAPTAWRKRLARTRPSAIPQKPGCWYGRRQVPGRSPAGRESSRGAGMSVRGARRPRLGRQPRSQRARAGPSTPAPGEIRCAPVAPVLFGTDVSTPARGHAGPWARRPVGTPARGHAGPRARAPRYHRSSHLILPDPRPRPSRRRSHREDPGSRREVAARRAGPARPAVGRRPERGGCAGRRRAIPRSRCGPGGDQGAGSRRRSREGRRREAGRIAGRSGRGGRPDPRHADQGDPGSQGARRPGGRDRQGVLPRRDPRPRIAPDRPDGLGRGRRGDRGGREGHPGGDPPRRGPPAPWAARLAGSRARLRRGPSPGTRRTRGPPPSDSSQPVRAGS